MQPTILKVGDKEIDVRRGSVYVTIGEMTFYIEHSDIAPLHVLAWKEGTPATHVAHFKTEGIWEDED